MTVTVPAGASGSNPLTATATNQAYPSFQATGSANYTVGTVEQITIRLELFTLTVAEAEEDIFLVLAQAPNGNLGKARYLIGRHILALREQL